MNTLAYYKIELSNILSGFNLQQTEELLNIANKNERRKNLTEKKSLSGIWKDQNPSDLEQDLYELRQIVQNNLDSKTL